MERLTKRIDGSLVFPSELIGVMMTPSNDAMHQILTRLAAYEDSGLEPEEIKKHEAAYNECLTRTHGPFTQKISQWLQGEQDGRLVELPFVAMVEQSLQDGEMKPMADQKHNGRYAVVYVDHNKWKSPLIDICGKPYNREEAENRMAALKGGEG